MHQLWEMVCCFLLLPVALCQLIEIVSFGSCNVTFYFFQITTDGYSFVFGRVLEHRDLSLHVSPPDAKAVLADGILFCFVFFVIIELIKFPQVLWVVKETANDLLSVQKSGQQVFFLTFFFEVHR